MQIPYLLLQTVLIPIISAPVLALLGRKMGKRVGWVACGILAYTNILLLVAALNLWNNATPIVEEYAWSTSLFVLKMGLYADGLSLPVAFIINIVCNALVVFSIEYLDHRIHSIYKIDSKPLNEIGRAHV